MDQILQSLRELFIQHLANNQPLLSELPAGSTVVTVPNTSRYRVGDQAFLMSPTLMTTDPTTGREVPGLTEQVTIKDITAYNTVVLEKPTTIAWHVSDNTSLLKAVNWQPLQRVYIFDNQRIPKFPSITISAKDEVPEWITLRGTSHEYTLQIRVYVLDDGSENAEITCIRLAKQVKEILLDHIHPIIGGVAQPLTADLPNGSTVVNVADSSIFTPLLPVYIRDASVRPGAQEIDVSAILSPTQIELATPVMYDFFVARDAEIIQTNRYMYDTLPSTISYGHVPGEEGALMRCAQISWFAREEIIRLGDLVT